MRFMSASRTSSIEKVMVLLESMWNTSVSYRKFLPSIIQETRGKSNLFFVKGPGIRLWGCKRTRKIFLSDEKTQKPVPRVKLIAPVEGRFFYDSYRPPVVFPIGADGSGMQRESRQGFPAGARISAVEKPRRKSLGPQRDPQGSQLLQNGIHPKAVPLPWKGCALRREGKPQGDAHQVLLLEGVDEGYTGQGLGIQVRPAGVS